MKHSKIYIQPKSLKIIIQLLIVIAWIGVLGTTPIDAEEQSLFMLYLPVLLILIMAGLTWIICLTTNIFDGKARR